MTGIENYFNYWNTCADKIINKYMYLMKKSHVLFSDIYIGCKCCYVYKTPELKRRCTEATKIFNSLHKEIDKFPKYYRGMIYLKLRKFKF